MFVCIKNKIGSQKSCLVLIQANHTVILRGDLLSTPYIHILVLSGFTSEFRPLCEQFLFTSFLLASGTEAVEFKVLQTMKT